MNELVSLIDFYKENKITRHVLEKELTMKLAGAKKLFFEIVATNGINSATSFVIATLPYEDCGVIKGKILIDSAAFEIYESKELLKMINLELSYYTQRIARFHKLIKKNDVPPVSESLVFFLSLYKDTLTTLKSLDFNKLSKANVLPSENTINDIIKSIENNEYSLHEIIEKISVEKIVPKEMVKAAEELSEHLNSSVVIRVVDTDDFNDLPSINTYHNRIAAVCTSTYGAEPLSVQIKHDYVPSTNQ